jgi:EAL domain-containing protein (putative c-di-GMP-specific phosphodiesterase class I)
MGMGCEYGQGHFYAEPMDEMELRQWLRHRRETEKLLSNA